MAAFAFESENLVWQRVRIFLDACYASPGAKAAFKAYKQWMAEHKLAPVMQFLSFTDAQAIASGGTVLGSGTAHIIAAYAIKVGTVVGTAAQNTTGTTTASWLKLFDDATNDTTTSDQQLTMPLPAKNAEAVFFAPQGVALATGLVVASDTSAFGTTDSTAGDSGNGFVLITG